jgi:hypothetical protein
LERFLARVQADEVVSHAYIFDIPPLVKAISRDTARRTCVPPTCKILDGDVE